MDKTNTYRSKNSSRRTILPSSLSVCFFHGFPSLRLLLLPNMLLDTREPGELNDTGRIPGAINIPVTTSPDGFFLPNEEFEDRFGFVRPSRDTEVIFYCKAGVRSRAAAGLAKEAGWTKVGEYPGSWKDWAEKGGAVERK